jgi:hypothetical protein
MYVGLSNAINWLDHHSSGLKSPAWFLFVLLLGFVPIYFLFCCGKTLTANANRIAARRFRSAAAMDERFPFVVLRPFKQDGLAFPLSHLVARGRKGDAKSYLNIIAEAVSAHGVLIAIGGPTATIDFYDEPRLLYFQAAEDRWPSIFQAASDIARAIILIPAQSPGVVSEMHALVSRDRTAKTIVFMPPTPRESATEKWFGPQVAPQRIAEEWEEVRTYWAAAGQFSLPTYRPSGLLFVPKANYSCDVSADLEGTVTVATLQAAIEKLLPHLHGGGGALSRFVSDNAAYEVEPPQPSYFERIFGQGG